MTPKRKISLAVRSALFLTLGLGFGYPAQAQGPEPAKGGTMTMDGSKMAHHDAMKDKQKAMMDQMKAQDAELTALVAKLNRASKDEKLDLIASILTRLVEQRSAMTLQMERMHGEMMQPMKMGKGASSHHPMMKGMGKKPDATPVDKQ